VANRSCDGAHKKYECDTKLFLWLLMHAHAFTDSFKDRFLPCATNTLVKIRQGRRFAQAALKLCGSLERHRDLTTYPTFISLNVESVACSTSKTRTRQHERRGSVLYPASIGGAFVKSAIKKWHRLRAEALAKQMPDDVDDALSVLDCLADMVEKRHQILLRNALENAPVSRLPRA
jgi:hypothetical protein